MNRLLRFWNWKYLFIILLVIHVAPIWIFWYFPTQDGPSHIYNSKVLKDYHDQDNYQIRKAFKLNLTLFPNWTAHALMMALMYVVPPMVAEKLLLSAAIALVPLSLWYLFSAIDPKNVLFSLIGFIYAHNNMLHMGFYGFALSVPIFLFTLGYWWKHRQDIQAYQIVILNVLLFLTYMTHFASYMLLLVAMTTIALFYFFSETVKSLWAMKKTGFSISALLRGVLQQLKPLAIFGGYMLLAYALGLAYFLRTRQPFILSLSEIEFLKEYFWNVLILVSYTDWHIGVMRFLLGLLFAAALTTLIHRIWKRQWFSERDVFLLLSIIFTVMFFKSPTNQSGGSWVNQRIYIYIFLFLATWFAAFHKSLRYIFGIGLVILSLTQIGRYYYEYAVLQPELAEQASAVKLVKPHSTFAIDIANSASETLGDVKYVSPFHHAPCYYGLSAKDIVYIGNYEAGAPYFPVNWASRPEGDSDYVLAWDHAEDTRDLDKYRDKYDLISSTRRMKLFQLKQKQSESSLSDGDRKDSE